jgi:hypothetical protein
MKIKIFLLIVGVCMSVGASADAQTRARSIAQICPNVLPVGPSTVSKTIYKAAAPLRTTSGPGGAIVGFRKEPTLIFNARNNWRKTFTIYDSTGNSLGRCPWATAKGHAGGRARCTMNTLALRRQAVKNTNSPRVYFLIRQNTCVDVPDPARCYGSVKGLCPGPIS